MTYYLVPVFCCDIGDPMKETFSSITVIFLIS